MDTRATVAAEICRVAIMVRGVVQGVGFRPFVYGAATARGLSGFVRNEADLVYIEVQGPTQRVEDFCRVVREGHPPQARVDALAIVRMPSLREAAAAFCIQPSAAPGTPCPVIPADLAICAQCLEEIRDPHQRRFAYPFTNCTNCGPRWSIIQTLPYDRAHTSMAGFAMCPECQAEYSDPADRRFHAQPIACGRCGPSLTLLSQDGQQRARRAEALGQAAAAVRAGQVLALKGLGGFQLIVDATNPAAVALLRQRKCRPHKPLAVMLASLDEAEHYCHVSAAEAQLLQSPQAPIVLLRRRVGQNVDGRLAIAEGVAPGNPYLGVMLPYTPLHHLLLEAAARPIVCTSGNLSEEPMATTTEDALARLAPIADVFLVHDRPIVRPVDDSVVRVSRLGPQVWRRARGYAPLPIDLGHALPRILALGGHLKNTVALSVGPQVVLSAHVGDLDNAASVAVHRRAVEDLVGFFQARPQAVACDLHPDYASTRHAEHLAARWGVPLVRVQHHHAHVAACMAEHGLRGSVLGFSWDGTGYGSDGTVWGSEALVVEGPTFRRVAHLRPFLLPGGDRAVRQPRRSALGILFALGGSEAAKHVSGWFTASEIGVLLAALERRVHCPMSTSMGRLFDAVAVLCGLDPVISFQGQAAMALEYAADPEESAAYPLPLTAIEPAVADWEALIAAVLADRRCGVPAGRISARFHNALVEMALAVARRVGSQRVVLTGGCFQNAWLSERLSRRLEQEGFEVYAHRQVPPGDGGIALGQLMVAACQQHGAA